MSPALAGSRLTTVPPGKSRKDALLGAIFLIFLPQLFFFFSFAATLKHVQGCLFCFKINVVLYNKKDVFFHPRMKDFCHRPRAPAVTITAGQTGALF